MCGTSTASLLQRLEVSLSSNTGSYQCGMRLQGHERDILTSRALSRAKRTIVGALCRKRSTPDAAGSELQLSDPRACRVIDTPIVSDQTLVSRSCSSAGLSALPMASLTWLTAGEAALIAKLRQKRITQFQQLADSRMNDTCSYHYSTIKAAASWNRAAHHPDCLSSLPRPPLLTKCKIPLPRPLLTCITATSVVRLVQLTTKGATLTSIFLPFHAAAGCNTYTEGGYKGACGSCGHIH